MEAFSIRVAEAWKLGTRGQDNGLLFVVARDDRKMRIEVGGGIEGGLTDAQSGRIIRNTLAPAFRAGRYGDGLYAGAQEALSALGALPQDLRAAPRRAAPRGTGGGSLLFFGLFGLWLLLSLLGGAGRRRRSAWGMVPGLGGGLFGGGGSRGGGWGGGGGGFSGGGASGNW